MGGPLQPRAGTLLLLAGGVVLGVALWRVAPVLSGDALFHLARVRKLDAFDGLSLRAVDEFADGGLHPGYAFPLWHGFLALIARLAGVDPALVVLHEASVLAPLALLVAYEAGHAVFRSRAAGVAVAVAQVGLIALAPGSGGAYNALALPATASRQLLVPAVIALFFAYVRDRSRTILPALAAAGLALALVHPTYAVFLAVPLAGYLVARAIMARGELVPAAVAFGAFAAPMVAVSCALLPIVQKTVSHQPGEDALRAAFAKYPDQLDVISEASYRLAPEVFGRSGAIAIAALIMVPLAALVPLRRWSAFVLGGSLAVLAVTLTSALFPTFADLVSISQARRAAGFLPFAFAFAGGLIVLTSLLRWLVLPVALGAGIVLQLAFPGDFGYRLEGGGPAYVTWARGARRLDRLRDRRARPLAGHPRAGRAAGRARGRALRLPGRRPRGHALDDAGARHVEGAPARAAAGAARTNRRPRRRLLRRRHELPDRRLPARLRRDGATAARRRHDREQAVRALQGRDRVPEDR